MKKVLFHRDYRDFQGGHLKVWDYYNHVRYSPDFEADIYFTENSKWDGSNPWHAEKDRVMTNWNFNSADILFVAGMDWLAFDISHHEYPTQPIINYIQHVRHGNPKDKRFPFLKHKAIRICVSDDVAASIMETNTVNGPVFVNPCGIDELLIDKETASLANRDVDVLISGLKKPRLARSLSRSFRWNRKLRKLLKGKRVEVLTDKLPRDKFLHKVMRARYTIFLPNESEGQHLPPLEGMALGTVVICPAGLGRSYCIDGVNCLSPTYKKGAILEALVYGLQLEPDQLGRIISRAKLDVSRYTMSNERDLFLNILADIPEIW